MAIMRGFCVPYDKNIEKYFRRGKFLGVGHNGIVFSLSKNRIIKIFNDDTICKKEYYILKRTDKSKYFPKVYDVGKHYIVREMVHGERLDKYLKEKTMDEALASKLLDLLDEFKQLRFTRLDIRCKDIYICKNEQLKIIDPKNNYSKCVEYPRHLMKGLRNSGSLDVFLKTAQDKNKYVCRMWRDRFQGYLNEAKK